MNPFITNKYAAVILAAGFSSRINLWKPGIIINGAPLIFHTIAPMLEVCERIIVVGGYNFTELKSLLSSTMFDETNKIDLIENKQFECGMFSSVKIGISSLPHNLNGIFITPGDMPVIRKETYIKMEDIFEQENPEVLIPQTFIRSSDADSGHRMKKGHPVLISNIVREEIAKQNDDTILREVLKKFLIRLFDTDDDGVITDVDTEEDLKKVITYLDEKQKGKN